MPTDVKMNSQWFIGDLNRHRWTCKLKTSCSALLLMLFPYTMEDQGANPFCLPKGEKEKREGEFCLTQITPCHKNTNTIKENLVDTTD